MGNSLDRIVKRLSAIDWNRQADSWEMHSKSLWALLWEYIARIAHWGKKLEHPPTHIMFDVIQFIDLTARADYDEIERLHHLEISASPLIERFMMMRLLDWAVLEDKQDLTCFELPPPYEPMLRFLEQGGWFGSEHGWIEVAYRSLYIRNVRWDFWSQKLLTTDLSDETLNALDANNENG